MSGIRWVFDLFSWKPNKTELELALSSIQKEERINIERFVYRRDALASLAGRILIRSYCCLASKLPWNRIILSRDNNNKPYMENNDNINFNISHQERYVVLAGEIGNLKLGVDVMKQNYLGGKPLNEFFRLMNRNFSNDEWSYILSSNDENHQIKNFYRLWTLKESYVKATGTGITVPLDKISFKISTELPQNGFINDTRVNIEGSENVDWLFHEESIDNDYCVAVALLPNENDTKISECFNRVVLTDLMTEYKCTPLNKLEPDSAESFLSKPFRP